LYERFNPRRYRIDIRQAPLLRIYIAHDKGNGRWLMMLLRHHLAGDHTTLEVMQEEIEAHLLGQADRLPAPLPFRNLVAQARLGVSREEHEAYFRKLLGDVEEPTAPFGLLDVQGDGTGIEEASLKIDADLARRIRERARKLGVSAASVCHLAWAQVLARVSGREDVVFGTVLFGRMQGGAGADRVMGLFMNTLPVRIQIGEEGVGASVRQAHAQLADLLHHEHASLAVAQRCSAVAAPLPLFSALLNYRHSTGVAQPPSEERRRAWEGICGLYGEERTNYPLTLSVDDLGEGFALTAQVEASIGPMRICEFMRTALESLVEALETSPATAVRGLEVLPDSERYRVLYEWNRTEVEYPRDKCIHELFEEQVRERPEAVAVVFEEASLSYGELNRRANRLAHYLRGLGVQADARVAICVERSLEMIVAVLGVLKAGGAYVPLDPGYPEERLRYMLADSAPVALLTQGHLEGLFRGLGDGVPVIDLAKAARWEDQPETDPERASVGLTPQHLAYVIYTSGSTGAPKGVMVEHQNLVNSTFARKLSYFGSERFLLLSPISFDSSVAGIFGTLINAGILFIAETSALRDPSSLNSNIEHFEIESLLCVPSLYQQLLEHLAISKQYHKRLYRVIVAGEHCPRSLVAKSAQTQPKVELFNEYGPTEGTIWASMYRCSLQPTDRSVPIGKPIANTRIYILDGHGEPVPVGVGGELYIGGAGVARGYLNRPELTAERFLRDPFVEDGEGRMYRTGDLGRWLADGNIEFLGRNDFQVKIRGFRIELGEIEARLTEHEGVREAVVIAREDTAGDKRLVAYYTRINADNPDMGAEVLRAHLSQKLPEYMVPAAYVRLEVMPLTANGKLDRKALPAPEGDAYATRGYEAPVGDTEAAVAEIWAEVLKLERVGRHDNFFELGGHSLLVVTVIERMRRIGLQVDVRALFTTPTVAELAATVGPQETVVEVPPNRIPSGCEAITPEMLPLC
jgi:amino acid adenylation domain-containing protein